MDAPITRAEHEEFKERMDEANHRQNRRIDALEGEIKETRTLAASVEKLAISMENMVKEQEQQGKRLETLEARDGEKWRQVTGYIITAIISIVLGFVSAHLGL